MSIGSRIAEIRKNSRLSQEVFGASLDVSRQAISKWESDQSLPDVEKLISIGRIYGVSIGWILGMEEEKAPTGELTEEQMCMVKEIVRQYIEALPKPGAGADHDHEKKRSWLQRRLPLLSALLIIALILWCGQISGRLRDMRSQQNNLLNDINGIRYSVDNQISGIANRVEDILKAQNSLLADYSAEVSSTDLRAGTISFSVSAVPKTYIPGMNVEFVADDGAQPFTVVGSERAGHTFSASVTCGLTDGISLSAVLQEDGKAQTQLLDTYQNRLEDSYLILSSEYISGTLWSETPETLTRSPEIATDVYFENAQKVEKSTENLTAEAVKICLFVNGEKAAETAGSPIPEGAGSAEGEGSYGFHLKIPTDFAATLQEGDEVVVAIVATDSCSRSYCVSSSSYALKNGMLDFVSARNVWDRTLGVD